jgi:hypothetical protein
MTPTIHLRCGACHAVWMTLTERNDEPAVVALAADAELEFDSDNNCTVLCGRCGAATSLKLTPSFAAHLRAVYHDSPLH